MKAQNRLSKLSRTDLAELINEIRDENEILERECRRLERQIAALQEYEFSDDVEDRLDDMEDMLRTICRRMTGRRSGSKNRTSFD